MITALNARKLPAASPQVELRRIHVWIVFKTIRNEERNLFTTLETGKCSHAATKELQLPAVRVKHPMIINLRRDFTVFS